MDEETFDAELTDEEDLVLLQVIATKSSSSDATTAPTSIPGRATRPAPESSAHTLAHRSQVNAN